jgi:hypothetical protein
MQTMRAVAYEVVGRGVMFAVLGIGVTMLGLSFDLPLMTRTGAILATLLSVCLLFFAERTRRLDHRRTEFWNSIPEDKRPPEPHARFASALVLRETYMSFAVHAAIAAGGMWTISGLLLLIPRFAGH